MYGLELVRREDGVVNIELDRAEVHNAFDDKLITSLSTALDELAGDGSVSLADGFELAAASLRHLVADPLLPDALWPPDWPAPALRDAYGRYDRAYRTQLSAFFRARSRVAG